MQHSFVPLQSFPACVSCIHEVMLFAFPTCDTLLLPQLCPESCIKLRCARIVADVYEPFGVLLLPTGLGFVEFEDFDPIMCSFARLSEMAVYLIHCSLQVPIWSYSICVHLLILLAPTTEILSYYMRATALNRFNALPLSKTPSLASPSCPGQ